MALSVWLFAAQIDDAVDAGVGALLAAAERLRVGDQRDRPFLEFMLVAQGEIARGGNVLGHADRLELRVCAEGIAQAALDQRDGEVGDVDADPLPAEFLRGVNRGVAATERVEHDIAGVGRGGV
jgi:hypothetical protein